MKRIIRLLCLILSGVFFVLPLVGKNPFLSKEVKDIPIYSAPTHPEGTPRSGIAPIITASLDDVLSVITITFQNAGNAITVELDNLDTMESVEFNDLGDGLYYLPFSGSSGHWIITIILASGDEYEGRIVL